jgi:hypothetical protein
VDPWTAKKELPNYGFIPATTFDNPALPPDYVQSLLEDHTPEWVRNYALGDWQSFEGMVFDGWSRSTHIWRDPLPHLRASA